MVNATYEGYDFGEAAEKEYLKGAKSLERVAKKLDLLEAPFVIKSNDVFHKISAKIKDEIGFPEPKRIYADWEDWFKKELRYGK